MKTAYIEVEKPVLGRKPKKARLDQKLMAKIGNALYHIDGVRSLSINAKFKNGTSMRFERSEDEDRINRVRERFDEAEEDEDD
jgi:hypothetical protein